MSTSDTVNALLTGNDQLAQAAQAGGGKAPTNEGGLTYPRSSQFGEPIMQSLYGARTPMVAREGTRFIVTNVPGTPIADGNASGFVTTTPALILVNNNPTGGKWIYPVRFKMTATATGVSSTNIDAQWYVDTGNRYTSGGTTLTPVNPNLNVSSTLTGAKAFFGALTAAAANAQRLIAADRLRTVIRVIGDEYLWEFGPSTQKSVGMATDGTAQVSKTVNVVPVPLPPQSSLLLYVYGASQGTAGAWDMLELEYDER
jgi:hypothetical protein